LLKGQAAIVTGASSGIGWATAVALAEAGADVVVNYHGDADGADEAVARVRASEVKHAGRAVAVRADVSDESDVERLFARTVDEFGGVDILVANAGIQKDAPIAGMTLDDWRAVIDVNLTGVFLCARAAIRRFKAQGDRGVSSARGKILCMSSVHEVVPWAGHANYAASKGGVSMLAKTLAQECGASRVRVNCLAPGAIRTPINKDEWDDAESHRELLELIPYGRVGEPEDVARAAVWLLSDHADYITGVSLLIDGGMSLYPGFETGGG
jgi:glucose 1-dehydrogenase